MAKARKIKRGRPRNRRNLAKKLRRIARNEQSLKRLATKVE